MTKKKEQADIELALSKLLKNEDLFGLKDETITFKCLDCGEVDDVPDFVVEEFAYDLKKGEVVETVCPFCEGTMRQARNSPK